MIVTSRRLYVMLGLAMVFAVACGGGGAGVLDPEGDGGPDYQVVGVDPSVLCPDATVLSSGMTLSAAGVADDALAAQRAPDPQRRLADYEDWGRVTGYFAQWTYVSPSALTQEELAELSEEEAAAARERARQEALANPFLAANCSVELYEAAEGAGHAFAAQATELRNPPADPAGFTPEVSERPAPGIGGQSIDLVYGYPTFSVFVVNFRAHNIIGSVTVIASGDDTANYAELLAEDLVRRLDESLKPAG
jgi:hypothetical protein